MSAVAEPGKSQGRAGSRGVRFSALGIGVIVTIHLAALAVLLSTEYGPFAITLSLLAWAFMNCLSAVRAAAARRYARRWRSPSRCS